MLTGARAGARGFSSQGQDMPEPPTKSQQSISISIFLSMTAVIKQDIEHTWKDLLNVCMSGHKCRVGCERWLMENDRDLACFVYQIILMKGHLTETAKEALYI